MVYLTGTMRINEAGHLEIGGCDTTELVREFGTPLWVMDEEGLRRNCREIKDAFGSFGDNRVVFASKSLCTAAVVKIIAQEGLGLDVVSGGELFTAIQAGFPMDKVYFHGNNKSEAELALALANGVGCIVADNFYELQLLDGLCKEKNLVQDVALRISPGVEAHTHEFVQTGQIDSKFGLTLLGGQALVGAKQALAAGNLNLVGLHCHIGSQIFAADSFANTAEIMLGLAAEIKKVTGHVIDEINLGGGLGIYYTEGDQPASAAQWAQAVMSKVREKVKEFDLPTPRIVVEPGRAIAGPAGITLYTLGSSKDIPGIRKYLAVDGGMGDNIRPALYGASYGAVLANKAGQTPEETVTIAGKCCESGDMLIKDIKLPPAEAGDILAVLSTGAYNYSMSNNYNRLPRPAMVLVHEGRADIIVKRESYEDIVRNDVIPPRLN